jgi:hypothetical protein
MSEATEEIKPAKMPDSRFIAYDLYLELVAKNIKQVEQIRQLQAENEKLKGGLIQIIQTEKDRQQVGIGFDEYIYELAEQALKDTDV